MRITWDENKRRTNLRKHGLDFADAMLVLQGNTISNEDLRYLYDERRYVTVGTLNGKVVSIIHTECENEIRIISFRKATGSEGDTFYLRFGR